MMKRILTAAATILALSVASTAPAHTIAYNWHYYGWGWGFQPYHVHHSHGSLHTHSHNHGGGVHSHAHGHVPGAHHSVSAHGLNVRSGPSTDHRIVHVLTQGEHVHVRGCDRQNWCEVTYSGHHHGWVYAEYLD